MAHALRQVEWIDQTYSDIRMGGSQPSTPTTTTQVSAPWAGQQPYLAEGFGDAQNLLKNYTPSYYGSSTVANQSPDTQAAIAAEYQRGANGSPVTSAADQSATSLLQNGGGYNANPSNSLYSSIANSNDPAVAQAAAQSQNVAGSGVLSGLANNNSQTAAQQYLQDTASGKYLDPSTNPALQGAIAAQNQGITNSYQATVVPGVSSSFESGNRYGSGAYQQGMTQANLALGTDLGNADSTLTNQAYEQGQQNQINAASEINSANQQQQAIQAGAANSLAANQNAATGLYGSLYGANQQGQLSGANGLSNNYLSGINTQTQLGSIAPNLANADYTNIGAMSDSGAQQDAYNQSQLTDQVNRYNYNQTLPYNQLQQYLGAINGNYGSTSSLSTPTYKQSTASAALSGAASGAALGTAIYPGIGTGVGAVAGGLYGLFS
jgi:hypothetical protein